MKLKIAPYNEAVFTEDEILKEPSHSFLLDEKIHGRIAKKCIKETLNFKPDQPKICENDLDRYCYMNGITPLKSQPVCRYKFFDVPDYIKINDWVFYLDEYASYHQHFFYKLLQPKDRYELAMVHNPCMICKEHTESFTFCDKCQKRVDAGENLKRIDPQTVVFESDIN